VRSRDLFFASTFVLALGACAPTLSMPRGKAHLDALAEGERLQHHGHYDQAADAYLHAAESAERRVDRDEALYRQSRVLARKGDLPQAIAICDQLGASETIARRTLRARLDASRYRIALGEGERADEDLRKLALEHPDSGAARSAVRVLLQRHVHEVEDKEQALRFIEQFAQEAGDSSIAEILLSEQAELLVELDRKHDAMEVFEAQVERHPYPKGLRWEESLWRLADLALEAGQPKQAIGYLERMVAAHEESFLIGSYSRPKLSRAALRIARIYRDELRDSDSAMDAYAFVRSEFPRSLVIDDALGEEAELRMASGQMERGCKMLRELVETFEAGHARRRAQARLAQDCRD
jgi:tetratricopeptide (TPR) repeat protein